jgi:hypothetical protein
MITVFPRFHHLNSKYQWQFAGKGATPVGKFRNAIFGLCAVPGKRINIGAP